MQWLKEHWLLVLPMVLGAFAVARLMPKGEPRSSLVARLVGLAAVGIVGGTLLQPTGSVLSDALFYLFAGVAVLGAVLMITHRNPAYSALWFAVVTLAVCGLFLLQSAPFLASATVIVYAGAIIVTFLFVLMLAQQAGATNYDQQLPPTGRRSLHRFRAAGSVAVRLIAVERTSCDSARHRIRVAAPKVVPVDQSSDQLSTTPQSTSATTAENFGTMRGLGRSLFGDYLFAVELAGTLLLVASIGAIVIAPKRSSGKL